MIRDKFSGVSLAGIPLSLFLKYYNLVRDKSENVDLFYINNYILGLDLKKQPFYMVSDPDSLNNGQLISSIDYRYPAKALEKHLEFMREIYDGVLSKSSIYGMYAQQTFLNSETRTFNNDFFLTFDIRSNSYEIISLLPYLDRTYYHIMTDDDYNSRDEAPKDVSNNPVYPVISFNITNNEYSLKRYVETNQETDDFYNHTYRNSISGSEKIDIREEIIIYPSQKTAQSHSENNSTTNISNLITAAYMNGKLKEFSKIENDTLYLTSIDLLPQIVSRSIEKLNGDKSSVYKADEIMKLNFSELPEVLVVPVSGRSKTYQYYKSSSEKINKLINDSSLTSLYNFDTEYIAIKYKAVNLVQIQTSLMSIRYAALYDISDGDSVGHYTIYYLDTSSPSLCQAVIYDGPADEQYINLYIPDNMQEKILYIPVTYNAINQLRQNKIPDLKELQEVHIVREQNNFVAKIKVSLDTIQYSNSTNVMKNDYYLPNIILAKCNGLNDDNMYRVQLRKGLISYGDDIDTIPFKYGYISRKTGNFIKVQPFDKNFKMSSSYWTSNFPYSENNKNIIDIYSDYICINEKIQLFKSGGSQQNEKEYIYSEYIILKPNERSAEYQYIDVLRDVDTTPESSCNIKMYYDVENTGSIIDTSSGVREDPGNIIISGVPDILLVDGKIPPDLNLTLGLVDASENIKISENLIIYRTEEDGSVSTLLNIISRDYIPIKFTNTSYNNNVGIERSDYKLFTEHYKKYTERYSDFTKISVYPFYDIDDGAIETVEDIVNYFKSKRRYISFSGNQNKTILPERYVETLRKSSESIMKKIMRSYSGQIYNDAVTINTINKGLDDTAVMANSFQASVKKSLSTYSDDSKSYSSKKNNMNQNFVVLEKIDTSRDDYRNIYDNTSFRKQRDEYIKSNLDIIDSRDLIARLNDANLYPTEERYLFTQRAEKLSEQIDQIANDVNIIKNQEIAKKDPYVESVKKENIQYYSRPLSYYKYCNFDREIQPSSMLGVLGSLLENKMQYKRERASIIFDVGSSNILRSKLCYRNLESYIKNTKVNIKNANIVTHNIEQNSEKKIISAQSEYGSILKYIDEVLNVGRNDDDTNYTWREVY